MLNKGELVQSFCGRMPFLVFFGLDAIPVANQQESIAGPHFFL